MSRLADCKTKDDDADVAKMLYLECSMDVISNKGSRVIGLSLNIKGC